LEGVQENNARGRITVVGVAGQQCGEYRRITMEGEFFLGEDGQQLREYGKTTEEEVKEDSSGESVDG
jgi:hypothetical protein